MLHFLNSVTRFSEVLKPKILSMTAKVAALAVNSNLVVQGKLAATVTASIKAITKIKVIKL